MSAFGGKADIIQGKADIKKCPLMTQSGHFPQQPFGPHRVTRITLFVRTCLGCALFFRDCQHKSAQQPQSSFQQPPGCANNIQK